MMDNAKLLNEVIELQAWAEGLAERADRIRKQLEGTTTPSTPRKGGLSEKQTSDLLARRRKFRYNKTP